MTERVMSDEDAYALTMQLVRAGKRGEPMPPVPECVKPKDAQYAYNLGKHYALVDAPK